MHLGEGARAVDKQKVTSAVKYLLSDVRCGNRDVHVFDKGFPNQHKQLQRHILTDLYAYLMNRLATGPQAQVCTGVFNPIDANHIATKIIRDL